MMWVVYGYVAFLVAMTAFIWHLCFKLRGFVEGALREAEMSEKLAKAWEAKAREYRQQWHEADPSSASVKEDRRLTLASRADGRIEGFATAYAPAWLFPKEPPCEVMADIERILETKASSRD